MAGSATTDAAISAKGDRTAVTIGTTTRYSLPDLHGNTAASLDAADGSLAEALRYDGFGKLVDAYPGSGSASAFARWKFQGNLDVSPTGDALYENGFRFYAPGLGTFTGVDTLIGQAENPLSTNRYLYAGASPWSLIDPTGHCARWIDNFCADPVSGGAQDAPTSTSGDTDSNDDTPIVSPPKDFYFNDPEYVIPPTTDCGFLGLSCNGPLGCHLISTPYGQEVMCGAAQPRQLPGDVSGPAADIPLNDMAKKIAEHALEGGSDRLPGDLRDIDSLTNYIFNLIKNDGYDAVKTDDDGRTAYWDDELGMITIVGSSDKPGTAFQPDRGRDYFNRWPDVGP